VRWGVAPKGIENGRGVVEHNIGGEYFTGEGRYALSLAGECRGADVWVWMCRIRLGRVGLGMVGWVK
jgi:hypothetical protein